MTERREEIAALAERLCEGTAAERPMLLRLCAAAEREVRSRLRRGVSEEACADAVLCACAFLAAASLEQSRGGEELSSLRAGSVTVTASRGGRSERAERLRREAERLLAPYAVPGSFAFCGVAG